MDEAMKKILEIVTETQEEVSELREVATDTQEKVTDLRKEIVAMRRDIDANTRAIADLADQLRGVLGYAKEIDALMARMNIVEKHLGLTK